MLQVRITEGRIALYDPKGSDDRYGYIIENVGGAWVGGTWDFRAEDDGELRPVAVTTIINLPDEAVEEIFNFVQKWRK